MMIKTGSPSSILKVTEIVKEGEDNKIKVIASRPEEPKQDKTEAVGGTD